MYIFISVCGYVDARLHKFIGACMCLFICVGLCVSACAYVLNFAVVPGVVFKLSLERICAYWKFYVAANRVKVFIIFYYFLGINLYKSISRRLSFGKKR